MKSVKNNRLIIIVLVIFNLSCKNNYYVYERYLPNGYSENILIDFSVNKYIWQCKTDTFLYQISYGSFTMKKDTISLNSNFNEPDYDIIKLGHSKSQIMDTCCFIFQDQYCYALPIPCVIFKKGETIVDTTKQYRALNLKIKKEKSDSLSIIYPFMQSKFKKFDYQSDTIYVQINTKYNNFVEYHKAFKNDKWIFKRARLIKPDTTCEELKRYFIWRMGSDHNFDRIKGRRCIELREELIEKFDSVSFLCNPL